MASISTDYSNNAFYEGMQFFGIAAENTFNETTEKVKAFMVTPEGQFIIGLGIGIAIPLAGLLIEHTFQSYGTTASTPDPFQDLGLGYKIALSPFVGIIGPILEELQFRGWLQDKLTEFFKGVYGFSEDDSNLAARITSVFFTSVIFGLVHFSNAIVFQCDPMLFLPQVIFATIMGFALGTAKELTGGLSMPCGMHIGNNSMVWTTYLLEAM